MLALSNVYLSFNLISIHLSMYPYFYQTSYIHIYLSIYLSCRASNIDQDPSNLYESPGSIYISIYSSIYLSVYLYIYLAEPVTEMKILATSMKALDPFIYLSIHLYIYLYICLSLYLSILQSL